MSALKGWAGEVIIVGAGPVGLATALQLGRAGIRTVVVERHQRLTDRAGAAGIHARTMETFRQWGIAGQIAAAGVRPKETFTLAWVTRLAGQELGTITIETGGPAEFQRFRSWSPEFDCACGQNRYEPIILDVVRACSSVELRFETEAISLEQAGNGVSVTLRHCRTGVTEEIRASYVVGADGMESSIRTWLGITETVESAFVNLINIRFRAPLDPFRAGRRYGLYWVINPDTQGCFIWPNVKDNWIYNLELPHGADPASYTRERLTEVVRDAVGVADVPIEIDTVLTWRCGLAITDTWRLGRVFLVGDAAHRFPPHGGFGMNSGIQDSSNLVWKLVAVLRWGASDTLLDTYELERKSVAQQNVAQSIINTQRMQETGWLMPDPSVLDTIERPEGQALREQIIAAIPKQRERFYSHGQQFGYIYRSDAVVADGTEPESSTVNEYRPTAHPGARAPHLWLVDAAGREYSTIDLYDGKFTLFAGADEGEAWRDAVAHVAQTSGVPISTFLFCESIRAETPGVLVQKPGEPAWHTSFGITDSGALLIRPDGHVLFRCAEMPPSPLQELKRAILQITSATIGS